MRPKIREWQGDPLKYAHVKYDGHFLKVTKDRFGAVKIVTKLETELNLMWVPSLKNVWLNVPCDTVLYGELWHPEKPASYIKTGIKNLDTDLLFSVFTSPGETLEDLSDFCGRYGLLCAPFYVRDPNPRSLSCIHCLGPLVEPLEVTHEGFVYKTGMLENWQRYKPTKTIDLIVSDLKDGNNKYIGLVGSLICTTTEGYVVANVSGFDYETRVEIDESYIGRVVEVKYQYVGSKGKLRHPVFVRWRDDKLSSECRVDQDPDLEEYYAEEV